MVTRGRVVSEQSTYGPEQHDHLDILSDEYLGYVTARVIAALEQEALDFGQSVTFGSDIYVEGITTYIDTVTHQDIVDLSNAVPELRLSNTGQTDPAGRYRQRVSADVFSLAHAASAAWATEFPFLTFSHTQSSLVLDASHGTSWLLSLIATNIGLQLKGNATAGSAVIGMGVNVNAPVFSVYGDNSIIFTNSTPRFDAGLTSLDQSGFNTSNTNVPIIVETTNNIASNQGAIFRTTRSGAAVNADEGYITFGVKASDAATAEFARMTWAATDVTASSKDGRLEWAVMVNNVLTDNLLLGSSGTALTVGLYGVTPVVQAAAIAAPTGGATVDAEARTAINLIRTALTNLGITA